MKEELRHKHGPATSSIIEEETKNELIKLGRQQARASFIKKLATSESPSPLCVFHRGVVLTSTTSRVRCAAYSTTTLLGIIRLLCAEPKVCSSLQVCL